MLDFDFLILILNFFFCLDPWHGILKLNLDIGCLVLSIGFNFGLIFFVQVLDSVYQICFHARQCFIFDYLFFPLNVDVSKCQL